MDPREAAEKTLFVGQIPFDTERGRYITENPIPVCRSLCVSLCMWLCVVKILIASDDCFNLHL